MRSLILSVKYLRDLQYFIQNKKKLKPHILNSAQNKTWSFDMM